MCVSREEICVNLDADFTVGNKFSRILGKFLSGISRSAPVSTQIAKTGFIFS